MIESLKTFIQNKEADKIISFISNNQNVLEEKDEKGSTGLLIIAYSGIDAAFTKAKELKRTFSFHEAIVCGRLDIVKDSLTQDKDLVNKYSNDGFTPLSLAAFFDQTKIAQLLLENGANPNQHATNPSRVNALHSAVAKENYDLCKLLLEFGTDVNSTQMQNVTPLHSAAHRGNFQIVKLLVENGAEINFKMDNGDTSVDMAKKGEHKEVLFYLNGMLGISPA